MQGWSPIAPNEDGLVGRRESLTWLGWCLFFAVQTVAEVRFVLESVYFLLLDAIGFKGILLFQWFTVAITVGTFWKLNKLLPHWIVSPLKAAQGRVVPEEQRESWRGMMLVLGLAAAFKATEFSLVRPNLKGLMELGYGLSLGSYFLFAFFALYLWNDGDKSKRKRTAEKPLEGGDGATTFARLALRIAIWSNGLFLLSECLVMPFVSLGTMRGVGVAWSLVGTATALLLAKLGRKRLPLILGLLASLLMGYLQGPWIAWLTGLLVVFVVIALQTKNRKLAAVRTWGFGLGQALGRCIGGVAGLFFLGLEGGAMGAALGETLMAFLGYELAE